MADTGSQTPHPRPRRPRRYGFLTLLLVALAAPAGWVAANESTQPYVVLFRSDAVSVPDEADNLALSGATLTFRDAARPQTVALPAQVARTLDAAGRTRIDGRRVTSHVRELAARTGLHEVGSVYTSAVGGFSARLTAAQMRTIADDPAVSAVLPDEPVSLDEGIAADGAEGGLRTIGNPTAHIPPGIRRVGARTPRVTALSGHGVRINVDVAVIDTGVERDHPDLNVVGGYNCTGRDRTKWDDNEGHGTHVAGIVGALDNRIGVTGIAPGARIWSVKVLDRTGHGFLSWVVCGVDWVTAQRDRSNPGRPLIEVANMSLSFGLRGSDADCGVPGHDSLHMAICRSVENGTVYVVAAGNESHNARRNRPAAYDEVITVSAMADYDGRGGGRARPSDSCPYWSPEPDDAFTSFSNYGPDIDLIAPGKCILSTYLGHRYAWMSGTSMATPHVAGAAAIYRAMFPRATPQQVRMALQAVGTLDWRTATDPDHNPEKALWIGEFRTMPDFSISTAATSGTVPPGAQLSIDIAFGRRGGFDDPITVSLASPSKGISATPVVGRHGDVPLIVHVEPGTPLGRYTLTIRATAGDVVHTATVTLVVRGAAPKATFVSPRTDLSVQPGTTAAVAWTEHPGGSEITGRKLEREAGRIRTPGSCDGVDYSTDAVRSGTSGSIDRLRAGLCYRWRLTLTDAAGYRASIYSGAVLVDSTAPRAPSVDLTATPAGVDLQQLGVNEAYVGHSGMLWVRAGASGSVAVDVDAFDAESGIAQNVATIENGRGWRVAWVGSSVDGALRLYYAISGSSARLNVSSVNGAGLAGPSTVGTLMRDADAPSAVSWTAAPADSTRRIHGTYFRLDWTGGSDTGSGLANQQVIARYRAGLTPSGECRKNGFSPDGGLRLASNHAWESGLLPNSCYVWSVRTLDNVGNYAPSVVSGYVITEPRR